MYKYLFSFLILSQNLLIPAKLLGCELCDYELQNIQKENAKKYYESYSDEDSDQASFCLGFQKGMNQVQATKLKYHPLIFVYQNLLMNTELVDAYEYEVSICAIFRNDARFLKEWVEFHIEQGVEHFWLYNNLSQDDWQSELHPYIDTGMVEIIDWPYESIKQEDWNIIQCKAYMDGVKLSKGVSRWVAFLDTDEFLFSPKKKKLGHVLKQYKHYPGIQVHWVLYGTSNVQEVKKGNMLNELVMRAELLSSGNRHLKSIVQPKYVVRCENPHYFYYSKRHSVNENFDKTYGCFHDNISVNILRINHYTHRDLEFFFNEKMSRRYKWGYPIEGMIEFDDELNKIYDPILFK